jgi:uncharacterized protein
MKQLSRGLRVLLFAAALFAGAAYAQSYPELTGRVVDAANILPADVESDLTALLAAHEAKTTNQVVVATVPSLGGMAIEEYGLNLARSWRIGQEGKNNGVVLLVAPNEREVRIEVGYGLEGALPDLIAKLIIESSIVPRFRADDYPGGVTRGVEDIVTVLEGDGAAYAEQAKKRIAEDSVGPAIVLVFIFLIFFFALLSEGGGVRRRSSYFGPGYRGSGGFGGGRGGGFSGGGGSFGGGGASGRW